MKEAGKISRLFKKKRENMYQNILFDLDGTLTNSELGITNSVAYAVALTPKISCKDNALSSYCTFTNNAERLFRPARISLKLEVLLCG